jgi:hypothetical protein
MSKPQNALIHSSAFAFQIDLLSEFSKLDFRDWLCRGKGVSRECLCEIRKASWLAKLLRAEPRLGFTDPRSGGKPSQGQSRLVGPAFARLRRGKQGW